MLGRGLFALKRGAQSAAVNTDKIRCTVEKSTNIKHILSTAKPGSLAILDIDDTIGRVGQSIGLDAWFRYRMQQYALEGHTESQALLNAIALYNRVQKATTHMVCVDPDNDIAELIQQLKDRGVKVIGLTARNHELTDKTIELLHTLGVTFSDDVLKDGVFLLNDKLVEIKNGIIFSDGSNKGLCLEQAVENKYFLTDFTSFVDVSFTDDSAKNCEHVALSLAKLGYPNAMVWHYTFAEEYLPFTNEAKTIAAIQESNLRDYKFLFTDDEAREQIGTGNYPI
ncbi:DUF2608 domain-containing protein [Legionella shakespearei]|uniref:Uncharacterized protein n=1 Tax=Legionella shakespearei DSM 23087 TaxID=1122169 RepID=A0A0W0YLX7_9GAMM|nr:DUF2608 domain-containing protein [Legionella shakespearei]KTD57695.1 hypothetical protein Lsha_2536 [Legionella shakespearei DSM 23087]